MSSYVFRSYHIATLRMVVVTLKELATEADMWDDVLVAEFDSVQAIIV